MRLASLSIKKCCDLIFEGNKFVEVKFKYNGKYETYKVCENYLSWLPKISGTKRCSIYIVNDHWFSNEEFAANFIPSFCLTICQ